ncbi:MAG: sensor histidine kinase [Actinomycetia bacterium]|nr:sensor histidine kinase [Actinomycetes bacterium]
MLANLVDNAARYSPEHTPVALDVGEDRGQITFRVTDQGPGIPPDQLERVFDRYHRLAAVRSRGDGEGTGLGLTIARWITELHGGSIRAEGAEPAGCRMVLVLPTGEQP